MAVRFVGDPQGRGPIPQLRTLLHRRIRSDPSSVCVDDMKMAIGIVIRLRSEMPLKAIVRFLEDEGEIVRALNRIQSIIPIPTNPSQPIQIYHPSFPDFVTSRERCPDSRFYVDPSAHERQLALRCLDILNNRLSEGVETLLKPIEEVNTVSKDTILHMIPQEVQYGCRFWALHVTFSSIDNSDEELMERLDRFSSTMLLRWVISMCILHAISDAIAAARSMQQWIVSLTFLMSISSTHNLVGRFRAMELFEGAILRH